VISCCNKLTSIRARARSASLGIPASLHPYRFRVRPNHLLTVDLAWGQAVRVAEMSEELLIADVEQRLTSRYADIPPHQISEAIRHARARFENSRIRDFTLLIERRVRAEISQLREAVPASG
jgi:hypothetical protein